MRIDSIKEFYDLKNKQKQTEAKILTLPADSGDTNILDNTIENMTIEERVCILSSIIWPESHVALKDQKICTS